MRILIGILVCFIFSWLAPISATAQQVNETTYTIELKVKGVGCNEDVKSIAANVEKLEGVKKCTPKKRGATTKFLVDFDSKVTTKEDIYVAVEDTPGCKDPKKRPYKVKNKD